MVGKTLSHFRKEPGDRNEMMHRSMKSSAPCLHVSRETQKLCDTTKGARMECHAKATLPLPRSCRTQRFDASIQFLLINAVKHCMTSAYSIIQKLVVGSDNIHNDVTPRTYPGVAPSCRAAYTTLRYKVRGNREAGATANRRTNSSI